MSIKEEQEVNDVEQDQLDEDSGFATVDGDSDGDNSDSRAELDQSNTDSEADNDKATDQDAADDKPADKNESNNESDSEKSAEQIEAEKVTAEIEAEMKAMRERPITKGEFDDGLRRVFGKIGELNSRISKPKKIKAKVNAEKLTATSENFDPEYAQAHAEELSSAFEFESDDEPAEPQLTPDKQLEAANRLAEAHPDYIQIRHSREWHLFKNSLPADVSEMLDTTWDVDVLIGAINEFKTDLNAKREAAAKQQQKSQQKQDRLRSSLPIKNANESANNAGLTEEDGFAAAASTD